MRGRLLLVVSLFVESPELVAGGKYKKVSLVGLRALIGQARMGPGPGPCGAPWALAGRALVGSPGPSRAGPY